MHGLLQQSDDMDSLSMLKSNPLFKMSQSSMLNLHQNEESLGLLKTLPHLAKSSASSPSGSGMGSSEMEALNLNMLKNSQLFNPALLALNPSLYAVQLAQLQAAQLFSQSGLQQMASSGSLGSEDSRKRKFSSGEEQTSGGNDVLNLSKRSPDSSPRRDRSSAESPLDLSGSKRPSLLEGGPASKMPKFEDNKYPFQWAGLPHLLGPLLGNLTPEALARIPGLSNFVSAASSFSSASSPPPLMSSPSMSRSGESKNPLERMSEIAKTGGAASSRPNLGGRHSAWQSQWINRGPETNKEVFKCVWCKESFTSLNALTVHMKETKHFGGSVPPTSPIAPQIRPPLSSPQKTSMSPPTSAPPQSMTPTLTSGGGGGNKTNRDILKEHLPLPRKLVRGQDVWLGRGEQQTKDILKCMWCGESFRSLDLMTRHMQETKHYTKVISQEQLMSWKAPDTGNANQNHVNAVLTCKVCEQGFSSLKELSDHMVKNNHFNKDTAGTPSRLPTGGLTPPGMSPTTSSASAAASVAAAAAAAAATLGSQNKEKRKKSLPVRKLLELERAQQEMSGHFNSNDSDVQPGKIACERCGDKIPMLVFVDHIRQCVGPLLTPRSLSGGTPRPPSSSSADFSSMNRLLSTSSVSPPMATTPQGKSSIGSMFEKKTPPSISKTPETITAEEPKSILGSLERMVQNNFGAKKKHTGPDTNMSILQRLGIDEGVDYTKPLMMDPTGALFRSHGLGGLFAAPQRPSASSRSNSSDCSSPDRFKYERSASIKSESSARSPNPADEIPIPPTLVHRSPRMKHEDDNGAVKVKWEESDGEDHSDAECSPEKLKPKSEKSVALKTEEDEEENENDHPPHSPKSPEKSVSPPTSMHNNNNRNSATPESRYSVDENGSTKDEQNIDCDEEENNKPGEKKETEKSKKSHPLAALQMLCDKTEKKSSSGTKNSGHALHSSATGSGLYGGTSVDPGAILAFSWACNQAVVNDSLLKCPFCDTPFISKGAYRHHLSKMHFVKDGGNNGADLMSGKNFMKTPEKSPGGAGGNPGENAASSVGGNVKEENAQSKFQKYSQMAKQLSCSGQP
jgi:uncharacterized C2H2 Zn-finger protein